MIITVEPKTFAAAVNAVSIACSSNPTITITGGIRIDPLGSSRLMLSAFDFEESTATTIPAEIDGGESVVVSGRLLHQIAKVLPVRRQVEIGLGGTRLNITSGATSFTLPTLDLNDWPETPEVSTILGSVDAGAFVGLVERVRHAAAREEARLDAKGSIQLTLASDGGLTAVASDGFQLAYGTIDWSPSEGAAEQTGLLVPAAALADIVAGAGDAETLRIGTNAQSGIIGICTDDYTGTTSLFDRGEFPAGWRNLLPAKADARARVDVAELQAMLGRAAAVIDKKVSPRIDLAIADGTIAVSVDGVIADEIDAETVGDYTYGVNVTYLSESLRTIDSTAVDLGVTNRGLFHLAAATEDPLEETIIRCRSYEVVVMGLRTVVKP